MGLIYLPRIKRRFKKSRSAEENKISDDETIQLRKMEEAHQKRVNVENEQLKKQITQVTQS